MLNHDLTDHTIFKTSKVLTTGILIKKLLHLNSAITGRRILICTKKAQ